MSADISTNPATRMSDAPRGLPLEAQLRIGVQTIHRRSEPASESWLPTIDDMRTYVELIDRCGYDSLWAGDHVAFAIPILDPLLASERQVFKAKSESDGFHGVRPQIGSQGVSFKDGTFW